MSSLSSIATNESRPVKKTRNRIIVSCTECNPIRGRPVINTCLKMSEKLKNYSAIESG